MSVTVIELLECSEIAYDKKEILRYMGCSKSTQEIDELIEDCLAECEGAFRYKTVFCPICASVDGGAVVLGDKRIESRDLARALSDCDRAVIFGATVGIEIDRLVLKYGRISPSRAVVFQAIGAERVEALCDALCKRLREIYGKTCPRFSPGYGDLSLGLQEHIFSLLECHKHIGLTLNDTNLMSPTKSVTAIVGIKRQGQ
ncbi:MAG: Vitamin B12 dependent methionine synthase activation subunit [Clostridia bacterium]|nr:Vitamin B12 dependent methionine synthase activation subunit [Clostridia bacterium]